VFSKATNAEGTDGMSRYILTPYTAYYHTWAFNNTLVLQDCRIIQRDTVIEN